MNRRSFLATIPAVALASPVIAKMQSIDDHPLMLNAIAYFSTPGPLHHKNGSVCDGEQWRTIMVKLNRQLLIKHGDELFPDPSLYLRSPRDTIYRRIGRSAYTFEFAYDGIPPVPDGYDTYEDFIIDILVDHTYEHFLEFKRNFPARYDGLPMRPYLPMFSDRILIDPNTFLPMVPFMTRFRV